MLDSSHLRGDCIRCRVSEGERRELEAKHEVACGNIAWQRPVERGQPAARAPCAGDGISASGAEVYNCLRQRGIKNLLIMGVHTNMCVLGRSFAIRQMTRWGIQCVLVRDLTDTMYNPRMRPFVSHEEGTELVIEHIERYWCPSVLSEDLTKT